MLDNANGTFGNLIIPSGRILTTEEDFTISPGTFPEISKLTFNGGGTLNVGGNMIIEALMETSGDCQINIGGYYKHTAGKVSFSGDVELDISTAGALASDVDEHNFFIGSAAEYVFGTGTVNLVIDIFNEHLGTKEEIYVEDFTTTNNSTDGNSVFLIKNTDGVDTDFFMKTDEVLGYVTVDVGTATTLTFGYVTPPTQPVFFRELNVNSGDFILSNGSMLEITDAVPANTW